MGGNSSKQSSSRATALEIYDSNVASLARRFDKSDFSSPEALVKHLQPGDLVQVKGRYIWQWFYSHFAVYIGNGNIVHINKPGDKKQGGKVWVERRDMVTEFMGKDVRKNNTMDGSFNARRVQDIVKEAKSYVGEKWDYSFLYNNCEHFASMCRYGRKISLQSLSMVDVYRNDLSLGEYIQYHFKSAKSKCGTLISWVKRKVISAASIMANAAQLAIGY
eukprot:TCONS_00063805-protein